MTDCCHTFVYHSVTPPSHCPRCGQCLHPAHTQPWPYMQPYQPYRPTWPGLPGTWMKVTSTTHTNTAGDPAMRV